MKKQSKTRSVNRKARIKGRDDDNNWPHSRNKTKDTDNQKTEMHRLLAAKFMQHKVKQDLLQTKSIVTLLTK